MSTLLPRHCTARSLACLALFLVLGVLPPSPAAATTIQFGVSDLPDVNPGEDLFEYTYRVSDFPFGAGAGFSILFDPDRYMDLEQPPPFVNVAWDIITIQPDLLLPDDGRYDAQALLANPSVSDPFRVTFVFLGEGTPSAQPFEIFDADFATLEEGLTVAIPEPHVVALLLLGLIGVGLARRWR